MFRFFHKKKSPLALDDSLLIGKGGVRSVYRHPCDDDKCVKILFNRAKQRAVRREERYLARYWKEGKPFDHLSRYFGACATTLGAGGIFQLVRDHDGAISRPLSSYLAGQPFFGHLPAERIATLLRQLRSHLLTHRIIVSDPAPGNIVVNFPSPEAPRLVLVDGIGNPHFIKIADYWGRAAEKIIEKKWRYYIEDNPSLAGIL